mmetsp:Transcript_254/g.687  ORF Transcript_254/g.687 Transcript_254/m.687 type:complete len:221 (+) Transcript_254:648-1310(+)
MDSVRIVASAIRMALASASSSSAPAKPVTGPPWCANTAGATPATRFAIDSFLPSVFGSPTPRLLISLRLFPFVMLFRSVSVSPRSRVITRRRFKYMLVMKDAASRMMRPSAEALAHAPSWSSMKICTATTRLSAVEANVAETLAKAMSAVALEMLSSSSSPASRLVSPRFLWKLHDPYKAMKIRVAPTNAATTLVASSFSTSTSQASPPRPSSQRHWPLR